MQAAIPLGLRRTLPLLFQILVWRSVEVPQKTNFGVADHSDAMRLSDQQA